MACDFFTFVDDERVNGPDEELTWHASHVLGSKQSYLGIQDAGRKARPSSKTPGAWAGSVVHVLPELGVCVLVSVEKMEQDEGHPEQVDEAGLEGARGSYKAFAQGAVVGPRFLSLCHKDVSCYDPVLEGFSPHHRNVERRARCRRMEGPGRF